MVSLSTSRYLQDSELELFERMIELYGGAE